MGKMRKGLVVSIFALIAILLIGMLPFYAQAAELSSNTNQLRIEQVRSIMPQMEVYYYLNEENVVQDAKAIQAVFAGKDMEVTSVEPYDKKSGMDFYILLDVSASISKADFQSIKAAIIKFQSKMKKNDRLTLITFGDDVKIIFGDKSVADSCEEQINALENKDMSTALFEAINQTAALIDTDEKAMKRSVAVVISDGEDFTTNKTTANEALKTLENVSLPIYSMVVEKTNRGEKNKYINDFGEFTRSSGGQLVTFNAKTAWDGMKQIKSILSKARVAKLMASSNQVYQSPEPLTLTVADEGSDTINFWAKRSSKDETSPVATAEKISASEIRITFSEKVINAEVAGNYKIERNDEEALVGYNVIYLENDGYAATLTFENELYNGEYKITYQNICDDSKEHNLVADINTLTVDDGKKEDTGLVKFLKQHGIMLGILIAVLVVILIVVLVTYRKIKKNKSVVVVDGKMTLGDNVQVKQKVEVEKKSGHEIIFEMNDRKQGRKEIPILVDESIFVGRSNICELYFNDDTMSKQHFAIEEGPDGFYIQDLNTANGTMINGVKINQKRKLNQGDVINAGIIELKVKW